MSTRPRGEEADSTSVPAEPPPSLVPPADPLSSPLSARRSSSTMRIPAAPTSRSLPPLPAVEPMLDEAAAARARGEADAALDAYKRALMVVEPGDAAAQATIYANIAEVKLAQRKNREAESNFEKALAASPSHLRSIDGLIVVALEDKDWSRVAQFRRLRADSLEDPDERAEELCRLAEVLEGSLGDAKEAAQALEAASRARPDHVGILLKQKQLYEQTGAWEAMLRVLDALCRVSDRGRVRSAHRLAQADVALQEIGNEARAVAFLELALDEDPENDRALSTLVAVRTRREEWAPLASCYERLVDRLSGLDDRGRAWEVCRRLAVLRRDRLGDAEGALDAFRGALQIRPEDAESRAAYADLLIASGEETEGLRELERAARVAPTRASTYQSMFDLLTRAELPDRAWLAATCLEELGAGGVAHDLFVEQFRPEGAIRPTTAVTDAWWDECMREEGYDEIVREVLEVVAPHAIEMRLETLEEEGTLPLLDFSPKQGRTSALSVVRTFFWAARALGIAPPDIYLFDDVPSGVAAVPARAPTMAIGPPMRSGYTVQQLAFIAGRHLTYFRPEHYVLVFFPTLGDLSEVVLSALRVVLPEIALPAPPPGHVNMLSGLPERLRAAERARLGDVVARLSARGGRLDLLAWIRHVELTANRAGLLLAGDLRVAMRLLASETRAIAELTPEAKRNDLLAYAASSSYATLRERLGVALHRSILPKAR